MSPHLVLIGALFLTYSPVILGDYIHHDDFQLWSWGTSSWLHPNTEILMKYMARPLGGVFLEIISYFVHSIDSARAMRAIGVCLLCGVALLFKGFLRSTRFSPDHEDLLTYIIFTLPGAQSLAATVSNIHDWVGIACAMSSVFLIRKQRYVTASGLFFLSLLIYQSAAMFVCPMVAVWFLSEFDGTNIKSWTMRCRDLVFRIGIPMIVYLVLVSLAVYNKAFIQPASSWSRVYNSSLHVFYATTSLGSVFPTRLHTTGYLGVWFVAIVAIVSKNWRHSSVWAVLSLKILVCVGLFLVGILPIMVSKYGHTFYRATYQSHIVGVIGVLWVSFECLKGFKFGPQFGRISLSVLSIVMCAHCLYNLEYLYVRPSSDVLRYIKSRILNSNMDVIENIHITHLKWGDSMYANNHLKGWVSRDDEFGFVAGNYWDDVPGMMGFVFNELKMNIAPTIMNRDDIIERHQFRLGRWRVTFSDVPLESQSDPKTLSIDLKSLKNFL